MDSTLNRFLHPFATYHGSVNPENLIFNANLQEFSQRVGYICNFHTSGKLSTEEAYQQVKALWQQLEQNKVSLDVG